MAETPVFGIDLGTTNSCIAMWKDGQVKILSNRFHENTTPSCVSFGEDGIVIGHSALTKLISNPQNTIFDAKRIIGQRYEAIQNILNRFPFAVTPDEFGYPKFDVVAGGEPKRFHPEEISALVLKQLKDDAECEIQQEVNVN